MSYILLRLMPCDAFFDFRFERLPMGGCPFPTIQRFAAGDRGLSKKKPLKISQFHDVRWILCISLQPSWRPLCRKTLEALDQILSYSSGMKGWKQSKGWKRANNAEECSCLWGGDELADRRWTWRLSDARFLWPL